MRKSKDVVKGGEENFILKNFTLRIRHYIIFPKKSEKIEKKNSAKFFLLSFKDEEKQLTESSKFDGKEKSL
jgi:hypothetical protein